MDSAQKKLLTNMIEKFVRICNKYTVVSSKPRDYGTGDMLYPSEIHMLNYVSQKQEQNISEIGRHFSISRSAASQTIMKLEKKGLCVKNKRVNQKNIYIDITDKGNNVLKHFLNYQNSVFNDLITGFEAASSSEIDTIDFAFSTLENHMDIILKEDK